MASISGVNELNAQLDLRMRQTLKQAQFVVIVGFTAEYAIYVHENLQAHHNVGQAKFLEEPVRTLAKVIADIVVKAYRSGVELIQSMVIGGLFLQREAQLRCPVDTGFLKNSAFTRVEPK